MESIAGLNRVMGRLVALECMMRSQLVTAALEANNPVGWLNDTREAMRDSLQQIKRGSDTCPNEWSEGGKALDEFFEQVEARVEVILSQTPREFPCD